MQRINNYLLVLLLWSAIQLTGKTQVRIDTVFHKTVGYGVEQFKLVAPSIPWEIHVLKINLKNPHLKLETAIANDRRASGLEKTSKMAARKNTPGHWVVGAINADFFNPDGSPVNIQVSSGEAVRLNNTYPAWATNEQKQIVFGQPTFNGKVFAKNATFTVNKINEPREIGDLVMFNRFKGTSTGVDTNGTEYIIRPLKPWLHNDTVPCIIDSIRRAMVNGPIPAGKTVLSAGSTYATNMTALKKGDTLRCYYTVLPNIKKINELVGGRPILIKNGIKENIDSGSFNITRHPRTALGFNADTSIAYFLEIDGRQIISKGIDLFELTDLMIRLGITNGMNLDGGGSSTMVVRGNVVNSPSDATGERSVANTLLLISTAPEAPVHFIDITPKTAKVYAGNQQQFAISALDSNYNPVTVTSASYKVSKPTLGTINSSGVFTGGAVADTGYVIVEINGKKDSAKVIVTVLGRIQVLPKVCVTDKQMLTAFSIKGYDSDSAEVTVQPSLVQWKCLDTAYGAIDIAGQFQGKQEGTARVLARYSGKTDTGLVYIQIGRGVVSADSIENLQGWSVSGANIDSNLAAISLNTQFHSAGLASLKSDYSFSYTTGQFNYLYLNKQLQVYGVPDSIEIDILSNGQSHRVFFDFTDVLNQNVRVMAHKLANNATSFETIRGLLPKLSTIVYPLTLKSLTFALGSTQVAGQQYQGSIYIDNMRLKFPTPPLGITSDAEQQPKQFQLYANYPNPCNPETNVNFFIPEPGTVRVTVYSILGEQTMSQHIEYSSAGTYRVILDTANLASGTYFCEVTARSLQRVSRSVNKLVVLK